MPDGRNTVPTASSLSPVLRVQWILISLNKYTNFNPCQNHFKITSTLELGIVHSVWVHEDTPVCEAKQGNFGDLAPQI